MKKLLIITSLAISAVTFAQSTDEIHTSIRGGFAFPATGDIRGTLWGVGADFELNKSLLHNSTTYLSVDWVTRSTEFNRNHMFPILLNQKWTLSPMSTENPYNTYGFIGVGASILDFGQSATVLAARLGVGMDFTQQIFGEATYVVTTKGKGNNKSGNYIGLYLGFRL